jgi:Rad3-related DNA helicase
MKNFKSKRLLTHNSDNRDEILEKHLKSKEPTVIVSPSMTEGVDLKGDLSRFQILCKVPYPYLGDKLVQKKMKKWTWWYPLQTSKTIIQSLGRSVRSSTDHAISYILDSDWNRFYGQNREMFPVDFKDSIQKV